MNALKPWQRVRGKASELWREANPAPGMPAEPFKNLRIHDLRHSFASFGINEGISLRLVGAALGHSQARTTERYAHLLHEPVRDAVERIGEAIQKSARGERSDSAIGEERE